MKPTEIKYYDWEDIQLEICREMGISPNDFRDYHRVIGGPYKDLWHEWLNYFTDDIQNGSIKPDYISMGESIESKLEWVTEDGKEWLEPFIRAVYKIWDDNDIKWVRYFW